MPKTVLKLYTVAFVCLTLISFAPVSGADENEPVRITVVATNDLHGYLEPIKSELTKGRSAGGAEAIAAQIKIFKADNPEGFVLLDSGDFMSGSLISNFTRGKSVVEFYNLVGYDAAALGNHEFDFGAKYPEGDPLGILRERLNEAQFSVVSANIYDKRIGTRFLAANLKPFHMIERKGIKIGIIGLSTVMTPITTFPDNIRDLEFKPGADEVKSFSRILKGYDAKLIIVLAHMGAVCEDECTGEVADLANQLDRDSVDLIVSGHTHTRIAQWINGIPVVQAYSKGVAMSRVDLFVDPRTGMSLKNKAVIYEPGFVVDNLLVGDMTNGDSSNNDRQAVLDPKVRSLMDFYMSVISKIKDQYVATATAPLPRRIHGESALGILITDAMRAYFPGTQVAMYNSGGIRSDLPAGKVNYGNVFDVIPFDNTLVRMNLNGAQIKNIIDWGATRSFGLMAVSGVEATIDMAQPSGNKVIKLKINGKPVNLSGMYSVVTNDFLLAGGDGFRTFAKGRDIVNTYLLIRDIFEFYLRRLGTITPPTQKCYTLLNWPFTVEEMP